MQVLLAVALALNLALEGLAAATLIGGPGGVTDAAATSRWSMNYGFAVIAIASASLWLWPARKNLAALTPVLGMLTIFHAALATSLSIAGDQPEGRAAHAVLALLFAVLFVSRGKLAAA